jgi:hypothetical protein
MNEHRRSFESARLLNVLANAIDAFERILLFPPPPFCLLSFLCVHIGIGPGRYLYNVGKPFNDEEASIRKREKSRYAPSMKNCKSDRSSIISCYICPFTITLPESDANV